MSSILDTLSHAHDKETFTEWLNRQPDYGIFPPSMLAEEALDFLWRYLIGENAYVASGVSAPKQVNTEMVYEILMKYSNRFRKERKLVYRAAHRRNDRKPKLKKRFKNF